MFINENTIEQSAIAELQALGWDYRFGAEVERRGLNEVVLRAELRAAVARLNPELPESAVEEVVATVCQSDILPLAERNQRFYRFLREGMRVEYRAAEEQKVAFVRLIDFQAVRNNHFFVVNQLSIRGTKGNRRPDLIGFVNGLPLVVFELKNPLKETAGLPQAFAQFQTYKEEIADLFVFNQILVISDGISAKIGSLTADFERFSPWRVVDEKAKMTIQFENELIALLRGLFEPETLLNYVQNFVLFERSESGKLIKKIAAYHQFYGVNEAVECTLTAAAENGNRKIGVMWHTQGSGKSISMLFYAAKLLAERALKNPTIVVVTDRNDLDGQLFATFSAGKDLIRQTPIQADGREALRLELAKRESGGVIFTTIQKFGLQEGELAHPVLNPRQNIIVISDEAHRSQYGFSEKIAMKAGSGSYKVGYAKHLRDALPNASFIGFTGTPISLEDKDTQEVFGRYVSIYDIDDAVRDGATVPIIYDLRQIPMAESAEFRLVIEEVNELLDDDENGYNFRLREKIMGTKQRLKRLAEDFVAHYEQRTELMDGKAMLVAMSRQICVDLYQEIIALRPDWHSANINEGAIKIVMTGSASDPEAMQSHIYSAQDKKTLERRFKDPNDPLKVVIVRDMWLTGFDAPCCNTMYIDKPMKGHNLMQAIARVNRVFRNKSPENGGLIVDYVGLTEELRAAKAEYTKAHGKGEMALDIEAVQEKLIEYIEIIRGQFATPINGKRFDLESALQINDEIALFEQIMLAANHILRLDQVPERAAINRESKDKTPRRNAFLQAVRFAKKGYSLCGANADIRIYQRELAFYDAVRAIIAKREPNSPASNQDRQLKLVALLNRAVQADGAVDLFDLLNKQQPDLNIFSEEFLKMVGNSNKQDLWLLAIERYLATEIRQKGAMNLAIKKDFESRLKEAMNQYHNQNLTILEILEELLAMGKDFAERLARGEKLGLTPSEIAFYDALAQNESAVRELGDEVLKNLAKTITEKLRQSATIDWQFKQAVRARMRIEVRRALKQFKYPPDQEQAAIEFVLKQAEVIADELSF